MNMSHGAFDILTLNLEIFKTQASSFESLKLAASFSVWRYRMSRSPSSFKVRGLISRSRSQNSGSTWVYASLGHSLISCCSWCCKWKHGYWLVCYLKCSDYITDALVGLYWQTLNINMQNIAWCNMWCVNVQDVIFVVPESIVITVYWLVNSFILVRKPILFLSVLLSDIWQDSTFQYLHYCILDCFGYQFCCSCFSLIIWCCPVSAYQFVEYTAL